MTETTNDFVRRFEEAWQEPGTKFVELFHPEGTLFQSGMETPIGRDRIQVHQQVTLAVLPDMRVKPTRWAVNGADVFIEWTASGTFKDQPVEWGGASRFTLRDGLIIEELAFFDSFPLRKLSNPALGDGDMAVAALAATNPMSGG